MWETYHFLIGTETGVEVLIPGTRGVRRIHALNPVPGPRCSTGEVETSPTLDFQSVGVSYTSWGSFGDLWFRTLRSGTDNSV